MFSDPLLPPIDRRKFLRAAGICMGCSLLPYPSIELFRDVAQLSGIALASDTDIDSLHKAEFFKKLEDKEIECQLCPRKCAIGDKERGYCGARENIDGEYYTLVYGKPCSINADPIEKKPFFHFLPGTLAYSIATAGCNLNCKFCQNWQISQFRPEQIKSIDLSPADVALQAQRYDCKSIAYTYSEPTIFYEYMRDCAIAGNERGLHSVMISAGYIQPEPLEKLIPHLSAIKIDLKSFREKYYEDICNGQLQPVLDTLVTLKKSGIWFEIVYLMVPTLNDEPSEIEDLCGWINGELGQDVPVHFTRFHPNYLLKDLPPTPIESLENAWSIAKTAGLHFPYVGNVYGHEGENTYCPGCGEKVIKRRGFQIDSIAIKKGACSKCGRTIPGVWS